MTDFRILACWRPWLWQIVRRQVLLFVDVIQHGPYNVSVRTGATTARVAWRPAFDSGHQLHHVVWYASAPVTPRSACTLLAFLTELRKRRSTQFGLHIITDICIRTEDGQFILRNN